MVDFTTRRIALCGSPQPRSNHTVVCRTFFFCPLFCVQAPLKKSQLRQNTSRYVFLFVFSRLFSSSGLRSTAQSGTFRFSFVRIIVSAHVFARRQPGA